MVNKSIQVKRAMQKISSNLYEARLKRDIFLDDNGFIFDIPISIISSIENENTDLSFITFLKYIYYLNLHENILNLLIENFKAIPFKYLNPQYSKCKTQAQKFINKLLYYLILIKDFQNISNEMITNRTGLTNEYIMNIENQCDISLEYFLIYCKSLNILDLFSESLSFKYDELGHRLVLQMLEEKLKN